MTTYLMDSSGIVKRWAARICRAILHMRQYSLVCLILTCIVGILSAQIALSTKPNAHPDEFYHMDAFCYFEKHWWLPPLNSNDQLDYGPYGESRVYSGEVVYFVYGRIGALIRPFAEMIIQKSAQHKVQIIVSGRRYQIFLPIVIKSLGYNSIYQIYRLLNRLYRN